MTQKDLFGPADSTSISQSNEEEKEDYFLFYVVTTEANLAMKQSDLFIVKE